jgi:hypothetical protein
MGSANDLATAMHTAWPRRHRFTLLKADGLRGLAQLASAL